MNNEINFEINEHKYITSTNMISHIMNIVSFYYVFYICKHTLIEEESYEYFCI